RFLPGRRFFAQGQRSEAAPLRHKGPEARNAEGDFRKTLPQNQKEGEDVTSRADPIPPEFERAKPGPKWTSERADFVREQYLDHRKSAGEIALMLGPAFTRNAVTGKLYRMGALQARSGTALGKTHGLPRVNHFCPGGKPKGAREKKSGIPECER